MTFQKMRLATKISILLAGVFLLAISSSAAMLFFALHLNTLMKRMVEDNLPSIYAAEELEIALLEQRGFVSAYILDHGNRAWLEELARRKPALEHWLNRAREAAPTPEESEIIGKLSAVYSLYDARRDSVIALYQQGQIDEAKTGLLRDMYLFYEQAYDLCEELLVTNQRYIGAKIEEGSAQLRWTRFIAGIHVFLMAGFSLGLFWLFFHSILRPLRQMTRDARQVGRDASPAEPPQDELRALGFHLRALMSDMAETRSDLQRSRDQLLQTEKLASVGKLAASVAHEIRNPLSSLKMRLFSLRRSLGDNPLHEDDLRVVSGEISRLESIIRNFLEFARPPALKVAPHAVASLLDKTLELFGHRLGEKDIHLVRREQAVLPQVLVDADQIKQVFINLLSNAVEAMRAGDQVQISTAVETDKENRRMAVVRFQDSGPGIPADIRERIFEPFFSTKEEGTGLGLCIAVHIMARHQGRLELESPPGQGTCFAVWIPTADGR